ncbi:MULTISPECIES: MarR family transcriptional regulator [Caldimonas]|jgi:DNA-binding MarR family transcriptional regulator|uniref:MarR family winged helix-turn-helix transcriptional regulator n=1 Tax=Caldimonas TaxID=196013 RepID=UPI0003803906|nr:MarR family transcriptional regulator [Caldimonas manganoxidans]MCX7659873.1 MarR family transcriptional regulator [Caldimonas manganoxidans]
MSTRRSSRSDTTPAGRLDEARLHDVLGYQLAQAGIVTDAVFKSQVGQPFGLRPVEYTVLTLIVENPGGSLVRLARALAVTAPNITMWIDRLESRGLVRREQSARDRRSQLLHATPEGVALARAATQRILDAERQALANHLSPGERAILLELLHKVACARSEVAAARVQPAVAAVPSRRGKSVQAQ